MNPDMLNVPSTRAETARRYLTFRASYGLTDANPVNSMEAASAALCEAVAEYSSGTPYSLAEVFAFSEAVLSYRDAVSESSPAEYDVDSLAVACGSKDLAILAVKLAGGYVVNGRHWRDDGVGEPVLVTFPQDFFSAFLSEWAART